MELTWRKLLKSKCVPFLSWLRASGRERDRLDRIAGQLADFLIMRISRASAEHPGAPVEFWSRISEVRRIVLGAPGGSYPKIYERVVGIAKAAGLKQLDFRDRRLELRGFENYAAATIKLAQHRVYLYLETSVGSGALDNSKSWPDYWTPKPSSKSLPIFALVFRRGRWPVLRHHT